MKPDAEVIATAKDWIRVSTDAPSIGERVDAKRALADLAPDLANRLEAAMKAIEDAPHGHDCKLGRPNKLKTGTVDFPCTCWKSRALNKPTKPTPNANSRA